MRRPQPALSLLVGIIAGTLALVGCREKDEGGSCDDDGDCLGDLSCVNGRCAVDPTLQQRMARQSGVAVVSEKPAPAPSGPGAVKVRRAQADEVAFVLCAADERLIGGWCTPPGDGGDSASFTRASIVGHSENDTIGAQWKCVHSSMRVTAWALCQKVGPMASAAAPAAAPVPPSRKAPAPAAR